jgi:hypothetical protein
VVISTVNLKNRVRKVELSFVSVFAFTPLFLRKGIKSLRDSQILILDEMGKSIIYIIRLFKKLFVFLEIEEMSFEILI